MGRLFIYITKEVCILETVQDTAAMITDFNHRVKSIAGDVNRKFNIDVSVNEINIQPPARYNAEYNAYLRNVHTSILHTVSKLATSLARYNIIAPVQMPIAWSGYDVVDSCLQSIEQRLAQY